MKREIQMWHLTPTTSKSFEYFNYLEYFAIAGQRQCKSQMQPSSYPRKKTNFEKKHVAVSTHLIAK